MVSLVQLVLMVSASLVLPRLADELAEELGPPHSTRRGYAYPVFSPDGHVSVRSVDAAVFTSPSPSVATALCALASINGRDVNSVLGDLGYFGGPLAIIDDGESLLAYRFTAPRVPVQIDTIPTDEATAWVRRTLAREASAAAQLELPLSEGRALLITEARRGLSKLVSKLMAELQDAGVESSTSAFNAAISGIRSELFGDALDDPSLAELVRPHREALRFPHLPLEAVAELYETLGLEARDRRERGIAYTPAWIADYLISRLPSTAFSVGPAVDPTCGSGTFLVAYLDRFVAERARRRQTTDVRGLVDAVAGVDIDPVALATSRLTLDLFAQRLGYPPQPWNLTYANATEVSVPSAVLMGNLPFGYRSHGEDDISAVILQRWLSSQPKIESFSLLLPDSFAYAGGGTARARAELRKRFRIEEVVELPEEVFDRTSAATLGVIANRGAGDSPVVRNVQRRDLAAFRITGIPSRSFVTQLPPGPQDPWALTPFFTLLERARDRAATTLGEVAEVRLGFQAYGTEATFQAAPSTCPSVLEDPRQFTALVHQDGVQLRHLTSPPAMLRRTGPVELYERPKLILRTTTNRHQVARLAAVPDMLGLWFTDKFIGIWPADEGPPLLGLAAYLQTAFCELWLASNNPSRKLRIGTLNRLPIPSLPRDWWERGGELVQPNQTVQNPRWSTGAPTLLDSVPDPAEWRWFEQVVNVAFGIAATQAAEVERYLRDYLTIGRR